MGFDGKETKESGQSGKKTFEQLTDGSLQNLICLRH
jgi:hypothetical protein